jgi:hypothetical protein
MISRLSGWSLTMKKLKNFKIKFSGNMKNALNPAYIHYAYVSP